MTCPHLRHRPVDKHKGNNIFAKLAYNSRTVFYDNSAHRKFYPHAKKSDLACPPFMLLPDGAPQNYKNAEKCFNDINAVDNGKIAYNIMIPFQKELTFEENLALLKELIHDEFVSKGHVVHIAIHHGDKDNHNDHAHILVITRRLIHGEWEKNKSHTLYYLRGTVKKLDDNGKVINPDAVLLSEKDKVDTPILKRKKLQYDDNGNILYKKGWQKLQFDDNGQPLLDDKGRPVLIDIREPDYDPKTGLQKLGKNGDYESHKQFKKTTVKHSDISNLDNIPRLRQKWQNLQNLYFAKNKIMDERGEILKVDLRSYAEQNKTLPHDEQLVPTKHVFRPTKDKSLDDIYRQMIDNNNKAKEHNNRVRALQSKKYELAKLQKEIEQSQKNIAEFDADDFNFIRSLNPRRTFIDEYEKSRNNMLRRQKQFFDIYEKLLEDNITYNNKESAKTSNTKRGKEKRNWLTRHKMSLQSLQYKLTHMIIPDLDIRKKAGEIYDKFTNKDATAYIGKRFGESLIPLAARFLENTKPDDSNPFDATAEDSPFFPDNTTNTKLLKSSSKAITGNTDFAKTQKDALAEWEQMPGQTPPLSVNNVMNIYLTASGFYPARLNKEKWNTTIFVKQSEHDGNAINQQYEAELAKIAIQEKAELQEKQRAAQQDISANNVIPDNPDERTPEQHKNVHAALSKQKDELLQKMIIAANTYSITYLNIDINTLTYKSGKNSGKPNPSLQIKHLRKMSADGQVMELDDMLIKWDKLRDETDDYYKKYILSQKQPASLTPDNSDSHSHVRTRN